MDYSNLDLRNKTFLDFTSDEQIIDEIVGDRDFFVANITDENRMHSYIDFADITTDKKLAKAIRDEFKTDMALFFSD